MESENLIILTFNQMTKPSFLREAISMVDKNGLKIKDVCCYALDPFGIVGSELKTTHGDIVINYQWDGSVSIEGLFSRRIRNKNQINISSHLDILRRKIIAEVRSDKIPQKDYPISDVFEKKVLLFGNFFDVQPFISEALKKIFFLHKAKKVFTTTCLFSTGCLENILYSKELDGVLM